MMNTDINAAGTYDAAAAAAAALERSTEPRNQMGREEFLKLLVAQLSHQDPLNPLQGHEFAAQLAQFSSVEQLIGINESIMGQGELHGILAQSINSGVAAGLIGKNIEATSSTLTITDGQAADAGIKLTGSAATVTVTIKNDANQVIRTIELGALSEGEHAFNWDGKSDSGGTVPKGDYTFTVTAKDGAGDGIGASTYITGVVERVTFTQEGIKLWVNGAPVAMGAVTSVE